MFPLPVVFRFCPWAVGYELSAKLPGAFLISCL
jgi:hypothetical protein